MQAIVSDACSLGRAYAIPSARGQDLDYDFVASAHTGDGQDADCGLSVDILAETAEAETAYPAIPFLLR